MRRISFDTSIVISILTNNRGGHRPTDEWEGIKELAEDVNSGRAQLILPTIIFSELLPSHLGKETIDQLDRLFRRKSVELHDLTYRIARRSAELRDTGRLGSGRALKAVDSIFIATAELANAEELFSADPDIYKAVGSTIRLSRPTSRGLSLFPSSALPSPWQAQ